MKYSHIIIDGNNLCRKNFYMHRDLSTTVRGKEIRTGAAFGSLTSLAHIKRQYLKPDGKLIVVWDRGHTRKSKIYPDYKKERRENRDEEDYRDYGQQRAELERLLDYTCFWKAWAEGEEADDAIATLIYRIRTHQKNARILLLSSDRDMHQLIHSRVSQMIDSNRARTKIYTPADVVKVYDVEPILYLTIQLMTGDKGDGVPGIRMLGPKTAIKIIKSSTKKQLQEFMSSDVELLPELKAWLIKRKYSLLDTQKLLRMTLQLLTLKNDVDVKMKRGKSNENRLADLFVELEFVSLLKDGKIKQFTE